VSLERLVSAAEGVAVAMSASVDGAVRTKSAGCGCGYGLGPSAEERKCKSVEAGRKKVNVGDGATA
jgi:hypothetical protein